MGGASDNKRKRVPRLLTHPNLRFPQRPTVAANEHGVQALLNYALECAALVVSPPKEDGEDNEFACEEIAATLRALKGQL